MAELLLELFSEEIPARMQAQAAETLARLLAEDLAPLSPTNARVFFGPRRIAWTGAVAAEVAAASLSERGPRTSAPEQALAGFLRKHGAAREDLREDGGYWLLEKRVAARPAAALIAEAIPALLRRFPWPKSMRWGGTSGFTWVRPLRRILCLLDGAVVPFGLAQSEDDGHRLASGDLTEGHRFLAPGPIRIAGIAGYEPALRERFVIADAAERRARIAKGIAERAAEAGYAVVPDEGLLDEVAGLVEWPVALLGRIDDQFMDLPPEVRQVSMRVNQRYFALTEADGRPAPAFVFAANIAAPDGGAAIVAGNERVLRARLSDARHFWDLDRRVPLESRVEALSRVTFHASLGNQWQRAERLAYLAQHLSDWVDAEAQAAFRAGLLAKADLTTGVVGEFPELQGVMGSYYALHDGEPAEVAAAIREHYAPRGPNDPVPRAPVSIAVALADKIDQLALFFEIEEKPTGSGDPYALRRAALGIVRILLENNLRLRLFPAIRYAFNRTAVSDERKSEVARDVVAFIVERLRVQLRSEGRRHDVLSAAFAAKVASLSGIHDDLVRLLRCADAVEALLGTAEGADLLAAYRRANNILRAEDARDMPITPVDEEVLVEPAEKELHAAVTAVSRDLDGLLKAENYAEAMAMLSTLRNPVDKFFETVTVNSPNAELRVNRLLMLRILQSAMDQVADFSKLEGK